MALLVDVLRVVHVITAILMAGPFYALVAVNQRAWPGPRLGDRADTYLENIIKDRTVPCFIFQATVVVTGLAVVLLRGLGLSALVTNPVLGFKFLLLLFVAIDLYYVHVSLQPQIDALFAQAGGSPVPAELASRIGELRLRRKRMASFCMASFCTVAALVAAMLGVQVWAAFPLWLTVVLILAIAALTWRAFTSVTPYGWA